MDIKQIKEQLEYKMRFNVTSEAFEETVQMIVEYGEQLWDEGYLHGLDRAGWKCCPACKGTPNIGCRTCFDSGITKK